jgi:diacylglycerol kinase (ATP)
MPAEVSRTAAQPGAANHLRRRALLLVNQHARRGGEAIDAALAVLAAGGVEVEEHDYPKKDPIPEAIRARAGAFDCVIVGGGDGTLHAAAPALVETGLPLGTGNDMARSLGIDPDPVAATRMIAAGQTRAVDLGEVNGHLFGNVASIGLSVELAQGLTAATKRRWGRLGYALAALRVLRRLRRFTAELAHNGRTARVRTVQVAVGNGRHYGGGMTMAARAALDDGLLHGYSLEVRHGWQLLALVPALRRGCYDAWCVVRSFACRELQVRTRRPRPVNADGEIITATPAQFRVHPGAVRVYAPGVGRDRWDGAGVLSQRL